MSGFSLLGEKNSSGIGWKYWILMDYDWSWLNKKKISDKIWRFDWIKLIDWCRLLKIFWDSVHILTHAQNLCHTYERHNYFTSIAEKKKCKIKFSPKHYTDYPSDANTITCFLTPIDKNEISFIIFSLDSNKSSFCKQNSCENF